MHTQTQEEQLREANHKLEEAAVELVRLSEHRSGSCILYISYIILHAVYISYIILACWARPQLQHDIGYIHYTIHDICYMIYGIWYMIYDI